VLLTTGCVNIGAEMITIFTFQALYGYIYVQIGVLVTVFLAGLLPGAWAGGRLVARRRRALMAGDLALCLLLLDIDHFKQVNDTHGHDAGDEVLKKLTEKCRAVLRETDLFARLGGEEFAALLIQTGQQDALLTADRLRAAIQTMPLPQIAANFSITISIGLALFDGNADSIEELMKQADQAMYRAKKNGRNCVVLY